MDARGGFARVRRRELNVRRVEASPGRGSRLAVAACPESARDSSDPVSSSSILQLSKPRQLQSDFIGAQLKSARPPGREPSAAPRPPSSGVTPHPVRCSRRSRSRTASSRRERARAPPGDPGFRVEFTARFAIVGQTQQRAGTPSKDRTPPRTMSPRTPSMPRLMSPPYSWWASTRTRSSP